MLDFADARPFTRKMHGEVIFCFGVDTWAKKSLSFKFGMLDLGNAGQFAGKKHGKVFFCFVFDTWAEMKLS